MIIFSKKSFLHSKSTQVECVQIKDKNSEQISHSSWAVNSNEQLDMDSLRSQESKTKSHDMNNDLNKSLE